MRLSSAIGDPPPKIPGRGLSKEEYCKHAKALQDSQVFKDTIKQMVALTQANNVEYSCWFVQEADGIIRAVGPKTDDLELFVDPGERPEGAIGQAHTHTRGGHPSDADAEYYTTQPLENRPYVYIVALSEKTLWAMDDEGKELWCD